jgi:hypothetical protein
MLKRLVLWLVSGLVASSLVVGVAFAGGSSGGGADNGNKNGNWHKNDTYTCRDGYTLSQNFGAGWQYDLNADGYICYKDVDNDTFFVDDISHSS